MKLKSIISILVILLMASPVYALSNPIKNIDANSFLWRADLLIEDIHIRMPWLDDSERAELKMDYADERLEEVEQLKIGLIEMDEIDHEEMVNLINDTIMKHNTIFNEVEIEINKMNGIEDKDIENLEDINMRLDRHKVAIENIEDLLNDKDMPKQSKKGLEQALASLSMSKGKATVMGKNVKRMQDKAERSVSKRQRRQSGELNRIAREIGLKIDTRKEYETLIEKGTISNKAISKIVSYVNLHPFLMSSKLDGKIIKIDIVDNNDTITKTATLSFSTNIIVETESEPTSTLTIKRENLYNYFNALIALHESNETVEKDCDGNMENMKCKVSIEMHKRNRHTIIPMLIEIGGTDLIGLLK